MNGMSRTAAALARKKELQLGADGRSRSTSRRLQVIESLQRGIHRLLADPENLADTGAERKCPLLPDDASQFAVMIGELTRYQTSAML